MAERSGGGHPSVLGVESRMEETQDLNATPSKNPNIPQGPVPPEDEENRSLIENLCKHLPAHDKGDQLLHVLNKVYNQEVRPEEIMDILQISGKPEESKGTTQCYNPNAAANRIAVPKGDEDLKQKTKFCFDFLKDLKEKGSPSGVTLHQLYAKPNKGKYREGEEYEITKESLGEGNMSAGKILVVKDKTTGKENAMKTVMIADFREDEVQCWIDLNDSGLPPRLYLFHYDSSDNKVKFHMEPLKKAKLLQEVIDEHMGKMWRTNSELVKPFSLCMFDNVLSAIKTMTDKNWTHGDLHGKNIMLDNKMRLRVLDFGRAKPLSVDITSGKGDNFKMDILEAVRKFTALYLGYEFDDQFDLKANWTQMLSDERLSSEEERSDLFNLIDSALRIQHPSDIPQVKDTIQKMLLDKKRDDVMREVARLLFPDEDLESYSTMDGPRGDGARIDFLTILRRRMCVG